MRFVVIGAGAVGGVVGGRLHQHGHDIALVARGEHLQRIHDDGLRIESPDGTATVDVPARDSPAAAGLTADDIVLLAVKSQDTPFWRQTIGTDAPSTAAASAARAAP